MPTVMLENNEAHLDENEGDSTQLLRIADIMVDHAAQVRDGMDDTTVAQYAQDMQGGAVFPPISVFFDGTTYWLGSGFHRIHAYMRNGVSEVIAIVKEGGLREARFDNLISNRNHGLPLKSGERRQQVVWLLNDKEWAAKSDRWISSITGMHHSTVSKQRDQLAKLASCGLTVDNYAEMQEKKAELKESGVDIDEMEAPERPVTEGQDGKTRKRRQRSTEENIEVFKAPPAWMDKEYEAEPVIDMTSPRADELFCEFGTKIHGSLMDLTLQFPDICNLFEAENIKAMSAERRQSMVQVVANISAIVDDIWKPLRVYARMNGLLNDAPSEN